MGGGEVIPNGSIHWSLKHDTPHDWQVQPRVKGEQQYLSFTGPTLYGIDNVAGDNPKRLFVTLRFKDQQSALDALQRATVTASPGGSRYEIAFDIELDHRSAAEAEDGPPNQFAQLVYEWKDPASAV